ncbi:hypothetical protein WSK_3405 [Novosphingobium sp. Rr 2-17]|nr:hypothetical protein WSK_3405 [Novosphingobium sp. Rr 2-17]
MSADEVLREMAPHRGLKLVKSRRRKAGVGDYGKYGLTDAGGRALLGIGDEGLTATAVDIENYLRAGAAGTWRQSADTLPDRPAEPAAKKRAEPDQVDEPATRARTGEAAGKRPGKSAAKAVEAAASRRNPAPSKQRPEPMPNPAPAPEPELVLRSARPRDAAALAQLLSQLGGVTIDAAGIAANLAIVRKAGGGVVLAEKGKVIGCCSWSVVSSLHRGPIGRIPYSPSAAEKAGPIRARASTGPTALPISLQMLSSQLSGPSRRQEAGGDRARKGGSRRKVHGARRDERRQDQQSRARHIPRGQAHQGSARRLL